MRSVLVLVALAAAFVLAACGDDDNTTTVVETVTAPAQTTSTGTTPSTTPTTTTPQPPRTLTEFQSPSKNIGCIAAEGVVRCDVRTKTFTPPTKPADCELDYGNGISIDAGGEPRFVCAGDTALNDGPVLEYGQTNKAGLVVCSSTPSAMVCRDTESGRGFSLSRDAYKLF